MGCNTSNTRVTSPGSLKGGSGSLKIEPNDCLLACSKPYRQIVERDNKDGIAIVSRDFSHEPMH